MHALTAHRCKWVLSISFNHLWNEIRFSNKINKYPLYIDWWIQQTCPGRIMCGFIFKLLINNLIKNKIDVNALLFPHFLKHVCIFLFFNIKQFTKDCMLAESIKIHMIFFKYVQSNIWKFIHQKHIKTQASNIVSTATRPARQVDFQVIALHCSKTYLPCIFVWLCLLPTDKWGRYAVLPASCI